MRFLQAPFSTGASSEAVLRLFFYHHLTQKSENPVGGPMPCAVHPASLCPLVGYGSMPREKLITIFH